MVDLSNSRADSFGIGADLWPGIAKLMEEAAEVIQVCAKLVATGGRDDHWSGDNLVDRLVEEMGDLLAALRYVHAHNGLLRDRWERVDARSEAKLAVFQEWDRQSRKGSG